MSNDKMREALLMARSGLVWYIESYPQTTNGSDDEALEQIDAALSQVDPVVSQPVAWLIWGREYCDVIGDVKPALEIAIEGEDRGDEKAFPVFSLPVQASQDHDEAIILLSAVFDAWENGTDCTEDRDGEGAYLGMAFQLNDDIFHRCCNLLNRVNPPRNASPPDYEALRAENKALRQRVAELEQAK